MRQSSHVHTTISTEETILLSKTNLSTCGLQSLYYTSPTFSRKSCSILMSKRCLKFNSLFPSLSSLKSYFPPNLFQHFQWHPYLCNCSRWKSGSILDFPSLTTLIELYPFPLITYIQFSSKYCSFCLLKYPICICFFLISMKSTLYKPPSHLGSFSILAGLPTSAFAS